MEGDMPLVTSYGGSEDFAANGKVSKNSRYQNILENKETNATFILKKRTTWEAVCQQYNAVAVSGHRTWQQLRHLYENLKQRSKKNIAEVNRLQYYAKTKEVLKKASIDKTEIKRTGGGPYKSILSEQDAQILAMVAPQVQPLSNPYDDAALYFDEGNKEVEDDITNSIIDIDVQHNTEDITQNNMPSIDPPCIITPYIADDDTTTTAQQSYKPRTISSGLTGQAKSKDNIKQQYFKAKLRNSKLENKYLINKNKMEINKYKIEMQILKLKLKKMRSLRF